MKLHLPNSLRKALMAVLASSAYFTTAEAGCMHAGVSPTIYTDFGQNMGRYSVYQVNELLSAITARDGILIPYTTGAEPGKLEHKMISFEGMNNDGAFTAVGYNYTATVAHNGCPNPSFTPRYLGENQAIHYQGVEYRSSQDKAFLLQPSIDYKLTRSSKIFTDITASGVFDVSEYIRNGGDVKNLIHYRAGAGSQDQADFDGNTHGVAGGYAYITGGVCETIGFSYQGTSESYPQAYDPFNPEAGPFDNRGMIDDVYTIHVVGIRDYGPNGVGQPTAENPKANLLPFVSRSGDSGSPVWAWNEITQEYELIACHQARGGDNSYSRGASTWTIQTMESFNQYVDMDAAGHTVHMHGAVEVAGKSKHISDSTNHVETTTQYGSITGGSGFETVFFCGVGPGLDDGNTVYTWLSLYDQKDVQNWYSYGNTYFNANGNGSGKQMHLGDLFNTENIVFKSAGGAENHICLDEDIDTGIGYVQFTPAAAGQTAKFYLESNGKTDGRDYMLNSAGYIVDAGAELHIRVTNTQKTEDGNFYFREWRKQGAGDMYLEGQGNNYIFLNLGGKGTTYLHEDGGYAAYNVLINNGATLNFGGDIKQIARDVTFGNGGGYLEFSGLSSFDWYSGENANVEADGFTINALTQDATLINSAEGTTTTLRYKTGGNTTFLGSFQDTENSHLNIIYEGGGTWTLNSIHTKLHDGSALTVANGTVELAGTNTVHALGSIEGKAGTRYFHPDDWHYADSTMNVEVRDGATFRLGSHARLTGDVNVQSGGTLEIAEGVKHQYEYIEGWLIAEDTTSEFYRNYYGLKGDVTLDGASTLRFKFSSGTDAENVYGYNITGSGNVDMQLGGSGATLVLSGTNDFTGTKHLSGGGLVAESTAALGNTTDNKWHVNKDAFIAVKGIDGNTARTHIAAGSTGVIALTQDQTEQVHLSGSAYDEMFIGALAGQVIQYGVAPVTSGSRTVYTKDALETVTLNGNKYWQLGGGGGELVVNFLLDDPNSQLVLGNEYTTGTVTLTNAWNRIGSIFFAGKVTLNYTSEEALGGSKINLDYTNRVAGSPSVVKLLTRHSSGAMMLDGMEDDNVDMFEHKELFLGAEGIVDYRGTITPDGGAYRFGAITGTLTLRNALADIENENTNLIVDGQTYSGGTLALAAQATLTGDVTVMGYDAARPGVSGGDIALRLDVDNAIASASSVTLKEGGILDVNGTNQSLNKFNMEAGSLLTDTSADWSGTVTLNVAAGETSELRGGVEVNTMIKNGEGALLLAGDNAYGTLLINNGTVELQNGNSLSASGVTMVGENGILNLAGGFDVTGAVAFSGGKALVTNKTLNGSILVAAGKDGTLEQVGNNLSTRINSSVEVAQGSTLNLKGNNGTFVLTSTDINEAGGTIALEGVHYLTFDKGGEDAVNVGGTISIKGSETDSNRPSLYSNGSSNNMTRNINHLHIDGGYAAVDEASWNTVWNIHKLTGNGNLLWNSHCDHWYSSRMVLDGENSFSGQFIARRTGGDNANRKYETYVQLDHNQALQFADVTIDGKSTNNYMSLAINTDNATMKSLSGNQYAVLYAGAANPGTDQEHEQKGERPLNEQPVSTRSATLTLTGTQDAAFSGIVDGGSGADYGFSLVKNGSATQTFSGSSVTFNDVEVHAGKLLISSSAAAIRGNVTLATGTELSVGSWTLDSEHLLTVYGNAAAGSAKFTSAITMDGGTIGYSGLSLGTDTPALALGSVVAGTHAITINFSDTSAIQTGMSYYLADGNWTDVTITDESANLGHLTAAFSKDQNGLYVQFTLAGGSHIWNGTTASHTWDATHFGQEGGVPGTTGIAVFTDAAASTDVVIAANGSVASMVIDSTRDYIFHSQNGSVVTTGDLVKSSSGKAQLSEAVVIGTADQKGSVEINGGELVVTSAATLANVNSIKGAGTLGISFQGAQESAIFHGDEDGVGILHIANGSYTTASGSYYYGLLLGDNSTYTLGADKIIFGNVEVNGENATIDLANRKLSAFEVDLASDLTLKGSGGEVTSAIIGSGHTVHTRGTLTINNAGFDAKLDVAESGKVFLKGGSFGKIGDITLGASSTLQIESGAGISNGVSIHMGNAARLQMLNGNGASQVNANIVMDADYAVITGSLYGNASYLEGSITGRGTLYLARENNHNNAWRLDSLITEAEGHTLALNIDSNVTLTQENNFSGGTTIAGSTVQVNNQGALGSGGVNFTGGTLKLNSNLNAAYLNGSGGTVQLNGKTLVLTENGGEQRVYAGTFSGGGSIVKQGSGAQAFSRDVDISNLTVSGGKLNLLGGNVSGQLSVAQGAGLEVNGAALTIASEVQNAGSIKFTNENAVITLNAAGSFDIESNGYRAVDGTYDSGNGFAQGTSVKVFNNIDGGQLSGSARVSYLGDFYQLDNETGIASANSSSSIYSVRKGVVEYNDDFLSHQAAAGIQSFSLVSESAAELATLRLDNDLADGVTILSAGFGGNVEISEGAVLNAAQLDAQVRTTLTGAGSLVLAPGGKALPNNVAVGDASQWTGTVVVSGNVSGPYGFAGLSNDRSYVTSAGVSTWISPNSTIGANLILEGTDRGDRTGGALIIIGADSGKSYTFTGIIKGDGDLVYRQDDRGDRSSRFYLRGDLSEWDGNFVNYNGSSGTHPSLYLDGSGEVVLGGGIIQKQESGKGALEVYFGGTSTTSVTVKGDVVKQAGILNLHIDKDTTFHGNVVSPDTFVVANGKTATLEGAGNTLRALTVNADARLVNKGTTVLAGSLANSGIITNSGTLTLGSKLTNGIIDNTGDIIISSLMEGSVSGYVDAFGSTTSGNGFATTTLTVREQGATINNNGGHIYYGGNDVTEQVTGTGIITSQVNHGTYYINSTDSNVTYSAIADKGGDALEYIFLKNGTQLTVNGGAASNLRTSQVKVEGTATLNMQSGATLVVDGSTSAKVAEASGGSTLNFRMDGDAGTHMTLGGLAVNGSTVNVSGSGVLDLGNSQYGIKTLNINGGTVYSNRNNGTGFTGHNTVNINGGGTLQLASKDNMGWQGNATAAINLQGSSADALAVLELGGRQTFSTSLALKGHSVVRAMSGAAWTGDDAPMLDPYQGTRSITVSGADNLLAVPIRMRETLTITVNENGELTFDGGVYGQGSTYNQTLTKAGAGKMILVGGGHQYTHSTFALSAGTLEVQTSATFNKLSSTGSSVLRVASGGDLFINGNATLASAITNNGTVSFGSGCSTLTLNGTFDHGNGAYLDLDTGLSSENGNGLQSGAYVVVSTGNGSYTVDGTVAVTYGGRQYTLRDDGKAYQSFDDSIYYVRNGTANYSQAVASAESITSVVLSNGATLNMQASLAAGVTVSSSGGTVVIGDGVVLSRDNLNATAATTVNGTGTYSLNVAQGTSRGENVSFGDDWHGSIRLYGTAAETLDLNSVAQQGDAHAPLELAGVTASLSEGTVHPDLKLTDADGGALALTVKNAGSFTFAGAISGPGTMANASGGNTVFAFSGADVSDWNGTIQNGSGNLTVNISDMESGGTLGAALVGVNSVSYTGKAGSDTYTVASLQTNNAGTTLTATTGTLEVGSLTGGGDLTVNGSVELAGGVYTGSGITVANDATLRLGGVQVESAVLNSNGTVRLETEHVSVAGVTGSGSIEAAEGGSRTLEIAGGGTNASGAGIGANVDLVMSGEGSQAFNGNLDDFNGAVDVLRGTLTLGSKVNISALTMNGGAVELADGSSIAGVRVASRAAASITSQEGGVVALQQAILNPGALTLAGVFDVSSLAMQTRDNGYIDANGDRTDNGSGFATVQNAIEVVRNVVEGSLTSTNARVRYNGQEVALDTDGWARFNAGEGTNYGTYYLRDNLIDNLSVVRIQSAVQGGATLNKIVFDNLEADVNLVVDTATSLSLYQVAEDCTANLTLTDGGSIDQPSGYRGVDGFVKLAGTGTYSLHDTAQLGKGVSLTDGWSGTVVLDGTGNTLDLSSRSGLWKQQEGGTASTVQLDGWTSALTDTGWETNARIVLAEGGLTVQGSAPAGETAPVYAFNGNVSGTGNITNNRAGAASFSFSDVAGWTGSFVGAAGESTVLFDNTNVGASIEANGGNVIAQFSKDGLDYLAMSGEIRKHGGSRLDVALLSGFVNFTNAADISSLLLGEGTTAIIHSGFTAENISGSGFMMVDGGTLTVTEGIDALAFTIYNMGTVAFSNTGTVVNLSSDGNFDETTSYYRDINGATSEKGNGFHIGGNVQVIANGGVGSITGYENVTVNYKGTAYRLLETGELYNADDSKTYYIHTGTVNYSSVKDAEGLVGLHLDNTLVSGGNATLNLDANLASTVANGIVSDGGTVSIGQGVTLQRGQLDAQGATTLTGQGTYDLGSGVTALGDHISLGGDWRGVVRISDAHMSPFTLSDYANDQSSVEVLGISGWWNTGKRDFNGKLILGKDDAQPEKVALKLTDASSNYTYTLNGGVSGRGDYMLAYDSSKRISATTHTIKGDVSSWTGSFIDAVAQTNAAHTATLRFENNTAVNGVVNIAANVQDERSGREDHVFNVEVVANQGNVHMTGNIEGIDKLTFNPSSTGRKLCIDNLTTHANGTTLQFVDGNVPGTIEVNGLHGSGILTLNNNCKATGLANFALNGGDYTGSSIVFDAMKANYSASARCVLLTLGDGHVAEHSVVHTTINKTGNASVNIGIAVNAETVHVGGLSDTITNMDPACTYSLVSGNPTGHTSADSTGFVSDNTTRTLVIAGAGGTTQASVGANLNLTMDSADHTQTFAGDMSAFNGALDVQAGTLAFTAPLSMTLHAVNVAENAALNIGSVGEVSDTIAATQTIINNGTLTLAGTIALDSSNRSLFTVAKEGEEHLDGQGVYTGSGYLVTTTQYYLVQGGANSTLNADSITFAEGAARVEEWANAKDIVFTFTHSGERGGTYYVNGSFDYSEGEMGGATAFIVDADATLSAVPVEKAGEVAFGGTGRVEMPDSVGDGGTFSFSGVQGAGFNGTLSIYRGSANTGHGENISLQNFNGTLEFAGRYDLNGSSFDNAKKLVINGDRGSANTGFWFHGNQTRTLTQDIELIGDNDVQFEISEANTNLIVSGNVTGNKLWKTNAGKMTLAGAVSVNSVRADGGTTEFAAASSVGTLTVSNGATVSLVSGANVTLTGNDSVAQGDMTVGSGAALTIAQEGKLLVKNGKTLTISGGSVTAVGTLQIGERGQSAAHLSMTAGTFTSGTLVTEYGNGASIEFKGGSVEFTTNSSSASAITRNNAGEGDNVRFIGTETDNLVLKAARDWMVDRDTFATATKVLELGNFVVDAANTGNITMKNAHSYGGSNTITNNHTLTLDTFTIDSGEAITLAGSGTTTLVNNLGGGGSLTVDSGTLNMGSGNHALSSLTVNGGKVSTTHSGGSGCVSGTININAGGTFEVAGNNDAFGYDGGATGKIVMQGSVAAKATLALNQSSGATTMTTALEMKGHAQITGKEFNTYGCGITVSGTDNTIAGMQVRSNVTVNTAEGAELTLKSLSQGTTTDASGTLTKDGAGKLILDGATVGNTATIVSSGVLELTETVDSITGALTVNSGATLKLAEKDAAAVSVGSLTLAGGSILDVSALGLNTESSDPYTLMRGGTIATLGNVTVYFGASADSVRYALSVNENDLVLTFVHAGSNLIWDGGNANWSDQHWHTAEAPQTPASFRDNDSVTFQNNAGTATLQGNVIVNTMTLEDGTNLVLDTNGHSLTAVELGATGSTSLTKQGAGTANFGSGGEVELSALTVSGGTAVFGQHVKVTGNNSIQPASGADIAFSDGLSFTGTGGSSGYALIIGNGSTVTLGGTSDLSGKLIGPQQGGTLALSAGALVNAEGVYNTTSDINSNGNVVLGENATLTVGASGMYTPGLTMGAGSTARLGGNSTLSAVTGAGTLEVTGGTVLLNGSNTAFTGDVAISGGTLKLGDQKALGEHHDGASMDKTITVAAGGTLDLNGKADANYTYTLAGGTLTNSGSAIGDSSSQTVGLVLTANSSVKVDSGHEFRLLGRGYVATELDLQDHTLAKTGTGQFHLKNTAVTAGTIDVQGGEVLFDGGSTAASVTFNGGTVTGTMTLSGDITLTAEKASTTAAAIAAGNHALSFAGDADLTVSGVVSGSGGITKTGNGTLTLSAANTYTGAATVEAGTLQFSNAAAVSLANVSVADGATLKTQSNLTISGDLTGGGSVSYTGASDGTLSLTKGANQSLYVDINATGTGKLNLSMGNADYFLYGTQSVHDITQTTNKHMEVRGQGDVTATGTVKTGNFDVGTTAEEKDARFTLSGGNAKLIYSGDAHSYTANVRGYGTFAVTNGATQELKNIGSFHGIFEAEGEGSVLTLSGTLGSGTRLNATNGGVINLTQSYTMDGDSVVDGGTVQVSNGLVVNGSVDLSQGTLTQTGGTVTVNEDKTLTLGEASLTSAIVSQGTVEFTKDIVTTGLQESSAEVLVGVDDARTATANHFDGNRTEASIRVVGGDGTVTPGGHKVTQGGVAYILQQDGLAVNVTESRVDYTTFLQHEAGSSLDSSAITGTAAQHGKYTVGVDVNNANLNVDSALMTVQATNANIINTANTEYIAVLQIEGGSNRLTGSVSDLAGMTKFARAAESSLRMQNADGSQYRASARAVDFYGAQTESEVTIRAAAAAGEAYDLYALDNARFTVESHKMVKVADGNVTVNNHIKTGTVSTGEAAGSLTLANGADAGALNEVIATKGDVTFLNMAAENKTAAGEQTGVSLDRLEIGAGKTVSFYEAAAPVGIAELAQEASVTVVGMLVADEGATLNADLNMKSGSTLDVRGTGGAGLLMGSEVTLNKGMTLSDYSGDWASWEVGTKYVLFAGVDGLDIGNGVTTGTMDYTQWVDAREYFDNIKESNRYFLCYGGAPDQDSVGVLTAVNDGSNVGMVYIMAMPEPTTSTLSLLALAALAARRRRK